MNKMRLILRDLLGKARVFVPVRVDYDSDFDDPDAWETDVEHVPSTKLYMWRRWENPFTLICPTKQLQELRVQISPSVILRIILGPHVVALFASCGSVDAYTDCEPISQRYTL